MLVNFLKLKNISKRGKIISLFVVGGVFILLVLVAIWSRNFADTLIDYVPDNTSLYIHFSRPKIKDSKNVDSVVSQILLDFGINDLKSLDIARELSVVGYLVDNEIKYGLIIKTNRPAQAKKIIEESNRSYKFLSSTKIVITGKEDLSNYELNKKNTLVGTVKRRFSPFNSISIYVSKKIIDYYNNDLLLGFVYNFSKNENDDLFLNIQTKKDGLRVFYKGVSKAVSSFDHFRVVTPDENMAGDFVLSISNLSILLRSWQDNLRNISEYDGDVFENSFLNKYLVKYLNKDVNNLDLLVKKNDNNTGYLFFDYDFYASFDGVLEETIQSMLKEIMAFKYPVVQSVYLLDGTRVREIVSDLDQFEFISLDDLLNVYTLSSPDNSVSLMYKINNDNTIITNNQELINSDINFGENYLKFNTNILPSENFWRYLGGFEYLDINSKGILLK